MANTTTDDEIVYRTPRSGSNPPRYHATRDCSRVSNSDRLAAKPRGVLFADAEPCAWCHGDGVPANE